MFEFTKKGPMADTQLAYSTTVGVGSSVVGNFRHRGNMLLSGHLLGDIYQDEDAPESADGFTAVIGKTGFLEGDIYSAHAIIKLNNSGPVDPEMLHLAASILAYFSRFNGDWIPIIYTAVKNLKGVTGSPGMVIYKKEKHLRCTKLSSAFWLKE